ncbi:MAG: hypothetical protein B9S26_07185 [Opitutia bacterium Tous-C4FEB]|nr:MAG: hypothetical protein B9S26_07185 [Opitutae bacterium Tous-C4FEB]
MKPIHAALSSPDIAPWHGSNELALIVSDAGAVLAANLAFARKVGLSPEACLGRAAASWCPPEEQTAFTARLAALAAKPKAGAFDQRWQSVQGWRWIDWETTRVTGGLRLIGRDVSRHRLAEGHLAKLSQAVEQAPVGILLTSPTGHVQYMNAAYSDYSGFTLEDALEADLPILSEGHPSDASYRQFCATVASGSVWQGTLHCPTKDGRLIWERVMVSPAMDAQGGVSHLLCIRENLTAQRELEEKLARAERRLDDELTNAPGDSLGEEALLTLQGAAAWSSEAASLKKGAKATLARIARITGDIAQRLQAREPRAASDGAAVSLTSLVDACARSLRPALPAGRSIAVKNIGSVPRVAGETWPWIHALSLATKHFFSGAESTVAVTLTTRHVKGRTTSAARAGVVQLEIKRRAGRGRRVLDGPDESLFRDSDLAFIAGVVTQAGGRVVSGFEKPWIDDLRIELPAVTE